MLCFGVFLHVTARPVAKSRTNLAQIREKVPNGWTDWHQNWHTGAYSSGNGYMPNKLNLKTQGGISGVLGVTHPKVWEAVKRLDRLAPNLVHVCGFVWEWT